MSLSIVIEGLLYSMSCFGLFFGVTLVHASGSIPVLTNILVNVFGFALFVIVVHVMLPFFLSGVLA